MRSGVGMSAVILAGVLSGTGVLATGTSSVAAAEARTAAAPTPDASVGAAGSDGPIGHVGRWLTDGQGRVVLLHGVNLVAKGTMTPAQEGFGPEDAQWLVRHGFDAVRLGLTAAALRPTPGRLDAAYLDSFLSTVSMLTSHGLLVLIDLHQDGWGPTLGSDGFPGWMTVTNGAVNTGTGFPTYYVTNPAIQAAFQSFWDDASSQFGPPLQHVVANTFGALARGVAGNPGVLGYDLINEPWPGTTWQDCILSATGCPSQDHNELDPYYRRMAAAIRQSDPEHVVFGEPFVLFNFGQSQTNIALPGNDPRSGMSFHLYTTTPASEPTLIGNAEAWSASTGGALLNTEFGATDDAAAIDRQVDELDGALIPWMWWSFDGYLAEDLTEPPSNKNTNTAVESALVRPHPVLVAGTPTALSYQESTRTLTFTYSTTGPAGQRFGPSARTVLDVPRSVYPSGWFAAVAGGSVVGHPGERLQVVAAPGSNGVTVTVSPKSAGPRGG